MSDIERAPGQFPEVPEILPADVASPDYSVVYRYVDGPDVVTQVVMGGELQEFRLTVEAFKACQELIGSKN